VAIRGALAVGTIAVSVMSALLGLGELGPASQTTASPGRALGGSLDPSRWARTDGLPDFNGATGWLNSAPLAISELRGKVVLIEFWTYTCINWRRQLPYTRAWAAKYKDKGLVVVGVHSPEFEFEKSIDNIRRAALAAGIGYPIAVDSDHSIWRAFRNAYWPALYFIDAQGRIRHRQFGEGGYERAERVLQELLIQAGATGLTPDLVQVEATGPEVAADFGSLRSPETYLGFARSENFLAGEDAPLGRRSSHSFPTRIGLNEWALDGAWKVEREVAILAKPHGRIAYVFHARDLHLVMGPSAGRAAVRFRVTVDGKVPGPMHGVDTDEHGHGTASELRLYQLIRERSRVGTHRFEIEFLDAGVEVYSFTFG
jgi:thiol-disulfide isomerase/thioredoxin